MAQESVHSACGYPLQGTMAIVAHTCVEIAQLEAEIDIARRKRAELLQQVEQLVRQHDTSVIHAANRMENKRAYKIAHWKGLS